MCVCVRVRARHLLHEALTKADSRTINHKSNDKLIRLITNSVAFGHLRLLRKSPTNTRNILHTNNSTVMKLIPLSPRQAEEKAKCSWRTSTWSSRLEWIRISYQQCSGEFTISSIVLSLLPATAKFHEQSLRASKQRLETLGAKVNVWKCAA